MNVRKFVFSIIVFAFLCVQSANTALALGNTAPQISAESVSAGDEINILIKDTDGKYTNSISNVSAYNYEASVCTLNVATKTGQTAVISSITANKTILPSAGGYLNFVLTGTNLKQAQSIIIDANGRQGHAIFPIQSNDTISIGLTLPANNTDNEQTYQFVPILDGVTQNTSITIKVAADMNGDSGLFKIGITDQWAMPEVNGAFAVDLLPNLLSGKDLTKPTTREEFCELAVRLYEKMTGKQVVPADAGTFTDTNNLQILKAYALGITTGTSTATFDPGIQINREQCATMLFRTIKLIDPNANYDVSNVKPFPDINKISSWAIDATKYMNKISIIVGDSNGNFMPRPITSGELESGYGMAKREEAILMVMRSYLKLSN